MAQAVPDEPDWTVFVLPLPGDALIELVVRRRLGLRIELLLLGIGHLPQGRAAGRNAVESGHGDSFAFIDLPFGDGLL